MKTAALLIVTLASLSITAAQAQFPAAPTADRVLGQSDFTSSAISLSQNGMNVPSGVAVDPVSGKVFVSISGQNRILRFANSAALANGANAEAVIGQPNFTTSAIGATAASLNSPFGLEIDRLGRLWVADFQNNRVLMYQDAANLPQFSANANLVLGQPDFVTITSGTTQAKMSGPTGVHVDAADNLWVAEYTNDRVLKFANVSGVSNGALATSVLGQPDFVTGTDGISDVKMTGPVAVVTNSSGGLWVADQENHRVLHFITAAGLANGAPANLILGQTDFVTNVSGTTAGKLNQPAALAMDRAGTLYISDFTNSRVVYHKNPEAKPYGSDADGVIGQPDLTTVTGDTTAQKLAGPYGGLDFDAAGNLWVSDYTNHRALRFPGDYTVASPSLTGKAPKSVTKGKLSLKGTATDPNGIAEIRFRVGKGPIKTAVGTTAWKLSAKLKPGKNTIEIVAVDSFGNVSAAKRVKVKRL
jgi:sugar lactone lactonase YvrE